MRRGLRRASSCSAIRISPCVVQNKQPGAGHQIALARLSGGRTAQSSPPSPRAATQNSRQAPYAAMVLTWNDGRLLAHGTAASSCAAS